MTIVINVFDSVKNNRPSEQSELEIGEVQDMFRHLDRLETDDKDQVPAFSLTRFADGKPRQDQYAQEVTGIILDIDEPMSLEKVGTLTEKLQEKSYVLYSTYSSQPDRYKLRVVLPLAEAIPGSDYKASEAALRAAKMLEVRIDTTCRSPSHIYYLPSCQPGKADEHFLEVGERSEGWRLDDLPELPASERMKYVTQTQSAKKKDSESEKAQEIYRIIDKIVADHLDGHPPIFVEGQIHLFKTRYWEPISDRALTRRLIEDYFKRSVTVQQVRGIIEAMKALFAEDEFPVPTVVDEHGRHLPLKKRYLACCLNATVDLLAGKAVADEPGHYLRIQFPYDFDPKASCDLWLQFLEEVFAGDADKPEKIALLQEYAGYLLTDSTEYQAMLWMYGNGANGKSVVNGVLTDLLGEANVSAVPLANLSKRFQSAELAGKLANICDEVGADGLLADDMVKQIVVGNRIQGERKGKDPFYYRVTARIVVGMNSLPPTRDTSHGYFRRILLLTFNNVFDSGKADRSLPEKLKAELPGIFVWAMQGFQRLKANGAFTVPASSKEALESYKEDSNPVLTFFKDVVLLPPPAKAGDVFEGKPKHRTLTQEVFKIYQEFCRQKGLRPKGAPQFGIEFLKLLGIKQPQKSDSKRYYPVRLRNLSDLGYSVPLLSGDKPRLDRDTMDRISGAIGEAFRDEPALADMAA